MRLEIPEIYWHGNKERITSIDFHPFMSFFVTGGSDSEEKIGFIKKWEFVDSASCMMDEKNPGAPLVNFIGNFESGHSSTVNCLKFSRNGQYLASSSDDNKIILWEQRERFSRFDSGARENGWAPIKVLLGHNSDVVDLMWSNDCKYIVSGSIDNYSILWSVEKGKQIQRFEAHSHFVQGVCIDPFLKYILTQSSDRTVKVWKTTKAKQKLGYYHCSHDFKKNPEEEDTQPGSFRLFLDETSLSSFFRRPDWSPDGSFCLIPADGKPEPCVLLYKKSQITKGPSLAISTNNKHAICVRFCPKLFEKTPCDTSSSYSKDIFELPYKMVFAIATTDSVIVYSTQSTIPICVVGNAHYLILTDLAWKDDRILAVSSSDGYCSFIYFEDDELGTEYDYTLLNEDLQQKFVKEDYYALQKIKKEQEKKEEAQARTAPMKQQEFIVEDNSGNKKKMIRPVVIQTFE